jgi:molybdate transport system substrate-binding protein
VIRAILILLLLSTPALAQPSAPLVFAAASLTDALTEVGGAYGRTGRPAPAFSFASSATLARQIENGAPAAIFVSADEQWMDYLAARGLIDPGSRVSVLANRLVLVAPATTSLSLEIGPGMALAQALGDDKLALADPDSVPAGRYARAALENLGVWREVEARVVRAENVRAALAFVERGEAAAGVVYATDAALSQAVTVVGTFPEISHAPITYPFALVGDAPSPAARALFAFMASDEAKAIYGRFGFIVR